MLAVTCEDVCLSFGERDILKNITFSLNEGDKLGIIGVNGAGKTSLFSIIAGETVPTGGNVFISKGKKIGYLHQNAVVDSDRTIYEEALLSFGELIAMEKELEELAKDENNGIRYASLHERFTESGGYEYKGRTKGTLKSLGIPEEMWGEKVAVLSGGQKTRLSLACILLRDPDILMLDEPTNHLDVDAMFWLENYLSHSRKTLLAVSHDRYFLDSVCTHILEIENGSGKLYKGNYSAFAEKKKTDREIQLRHYENQQREIKRQEAYIEQQRRWNRERNIIAAESRQKLLDKMELVEKPDSLPDSARISFRVSGESGNDVLTVTNLTKGFGERKLFEKLSFLVKKHDRLIITGYNGCGKSTLIKTISGRIDADGGYSVRGANVTVGYYDQEKRELRDENTVLEQLWDRYPKMTETEIRKALALFLFKGDDVFKKVSVLSGGEKARLSLAGLMLSEVNLLILDEPTNHLDISTCEALEDAITEFPGTVIAVSHDRYFIEKLATRIMFFGEPKPEGAFYSPYFVEGGFEEYISLFSGEAESASKPLEVMTAQKEKYLENKKDRAEQRKKEASLRRAKAEAEELEKKIEEYQKLLEGEAAYDAAKYSEISGKTEEAEARLLELYELIDSEEGL